MKPVLCVGDVCMDFIIPYAEALHAKNGGDLCRAETEVRPYPGGSVANTASAIARLGVPVLFAGSCGSDAFGRMLKCDLEREGVDCSLLRTDDARSSQMVFLVLDEHSERTAFAYPAHGGVQHAILPEQFPDDLTDRIGWLHVNGMMFREEPAASTQLMLMRMCRNAGIPVSLDINARIESRNDPVFLHNLLEAKQYCTVVFGSADDEIPLLFRNVYDDDAIAVISRSGAKGSEYRCADMRFRSPAFSVDAVDTTGAGDTFDGAFIAACMRGLSPVDAMREANAAAAICVCSHSGRACPDRAALDVFLQQHPLS